MTQSVVFPDAALEAIDVSRVCKAPDAPWDVRNERLAEAIRLSTDNPAESEARVRQLLEQGLHINARREGERTAQELAAYYEAPVRITSLLAYASREGRATASVPGEAVVPVPGRLRVLKLAFHGSAREYFRIWAVNLCLTLLTLGIFSAWAKVRKKRYFYSHTTLDHSPFQYLGQPIPILKGRLVALVLFLTWYLSSHFFLKLMPLVIALAFVLAPWVLVRSAAFNARYSAYRNINFRFTAGYRQAFATLYAWGLIPLMLIGAFVQWQWEDPKLMIGAFALFSFYLPFWLAGIRRFLVGHLQYGGINGQLSITGGNFYFIYFKAGLIISGLATIAGIIMLALVNVTKDWGFGEAIGLLALLPFYLAYAIGYAYSQAKIGNLVWNNTQLGPLQFQSVLTGRGLTWLYMTNALAILFSAGLLIPWAVVRSYRYRAEHLRGQLQGDWSVFRGAEKGVVGAAGAEVGDLFDLDFSL